MGKNTSNMVSVAKPLATGALSVAAAATTPPKDATTALDGAFKNLGYLGEDGMANGIETDTEKIKAWGGDTVLTVRTSRTETFTCKLIQSLDPEVLKEVFGETNVKESGGKIAITHNGTPLARRVFVFEMLQTGGKVRRVVIPNGEITEVDEVVFKDGEEIGYPVTISAFPDTTGNTAYEYIASQA